MKTGTPIQCREPQSQDTPMSQNCQSTSMSKNTHVCKNNNGESASRQHKQVQSDDSGLCVEVSPTSDAKQSWPPAPIVCRPKERRSSQPTKYPNLLHGPPARTRPPRGQPEETGLRKPPTGQATAEIPEEGQQQPGHRREPRRAPRTH